jgi:hypothetical protein
VARLSSGFAEDGTYTSKPLDARQIARWGTARASAKVPPGTSVTLATRSGNVADPEDKTWSSWSDEAAVGDGYVSLTSPAARFLQYRLTFHAAAGAAPELNRLELIYQVGNLAPTVTAIDVSTTPQENRRRVEPGAGYPKRYVQIAASDTNGDELVWDLYLRPVDVEDWLRVAKNLTEPKYTWDARTAPDGRYEMRVVVSDAPSNPPSRQLRGARISEPFLVDNTAPELNDLGARTGPGGVKLRGVAVDRTSRITDIQFSVDSGQTWQAAAPVDGICDSNREAFSVTIPDMEAGRHRITVKVLDELNNVGYGYAEVTVPEK